LLHVPFDLSLAPILLFLLRFPLIFEARLEGCCQKHRVAPQKALETQLLPIATVIPERHLQRRVQLVCTLKASILTAKRTTPQFHLSDLRAFQTGYYSISPNETPLSQIDTGNCHALSRKIKGHQVECQSGRRLPAY
jgi:hypothetical protein